MKRKWRERFLAFILCLAFFVPLRTAVRADSRITVRLPYVQTFTNDSVRANVNSTFTYRLTPLNNAPMPEGTSGNAYDFTLTGTSSGNIDLNITYYHPDYYSYEVTAYVPQEEDGYTYDRKVYTVTITVRNAESGGLECGPVVISDEADEKYGSLQFSPRFYAPRPAVPSQIMPPGRPVPQAPVLQAARPAMMPVPEEEPAPTPTPSPTPTPEIIPDEPVPEVRPEGHWALINLICTILANLISLALIILYFKKDEDEDDDDRAEDTHRTGRRGMTRVFSVITGIASIIIFILTENLTQPMIWYDKWTILMAVLMIVNIILAVIASQKNRDEEEKAAA